MDSGVILPVSSPDIQTDGVSHTIKVPVEADCIYALSTVSGRSFSRHTVTGGNPANICIVTFVQCWTNVEDVGPTLYKCYSNVFCVCWEETYYH